MKIDLTDIEAKVTATLGVEDSTIVLLDAIKAELDEMATSEADKAAIQAKLNEFSAALGAKSDALAAAVAAVPATPAA
jgi:hypothetical protein